jgi:hypothetical protein
MRTGENPDDDQRKCSNRRSHFALQLRHPTAAHQDNTVETIDAIEHLYPIPTMSELGQLSPIPTDWRNVRCALNIGHFQWLGRRHQLERLKCGAQRSFGCMVGNGER